MNEIEWLPPHTQEPLFQFVSIFSQPHLMFWTQTLLVFLFHWAFYVRGLPLSHMQRRPRQGKSLNMDRNTPTPRSTCLDSLKAAFCWALQNQGSFCLSSVYKGASTVDKFGKNLKKYNYSPRYDFSSNTFFGVGASCIALTFSVPDAVPLRRSCVDVHHGRSHEYTFSLYNPASCNWRNTSSREAKCSASVGPVTIMSSRYTTILRINSITRWKIAGAEDASKGSQLYWNRPWCVLNITYCETPCSKESVGIPVTYAIL